MGSAYITWGSWAYMKYPTATDWSGVAIADEEELTSEAVSLSGSVACEVSVVAVEDNTGACDGNLYAYILKDTDGTNYENFTADDDNDAPELGGVVDAYQNKTRRRAFTISAETCGSFKVALDNDSGQELATTVRYRLATVTTT